MAEMIPPTIGFRVGIIYLTGAIEIAAAVGLLAEQLKSLTAWLLIIFFIAVLPANINAAMKKVDYQTGTNTGKGVQYLWLRVPLQLLFIMWVYFFGVYME